MKVFDCFFSSRREAVFLSNQRPLASFHITNEQPLSRPSLLSHMYDKIVSPTSEPHNGQAPRDSGTRTVLSGHGHGFYRPSLALCPLFHYVCISLVGALCTPSSLIPCLQLILVGSNPLIGILLKISIILIP